MRVITRPMSKIAAPKPGLADMNKGCNSQRCASSSWLMFSEATRFDLSRQRNEQCRVTNAGHAANVFAQRRRRTIIYDVKLPLASEFQSRMEGGFMSEQKLWTTWCHYGATGEGVTILARIGYARDPAQCKEQFGEAFDPFWNAFAECMPGIVRNQVTSLLFSEATFDLVQSLDPAGALEACAWLHYNLS